MATSAYKLKNQCLSLEVQENQISVADNSVGIQIENNILLIKKIKSQTCSIPSILQPELPKIDPNSAIGSEHKNRIQRKLFGLKTKENKNKIISTLKVIFSIIFFFIIIRLWGFQISESLKDLGENKEKSQKMQLVSMQNYNINIRQIKNDKIKDANYYPDPQQINKIRNQQNQQNQQFTKFTQNKQSYSESPKQSHQNDNEQFEFQESIIYEGKQRRFTQKNRADDTIEIKADKRESNSSQDSIIEKNQNMQSSSVPFEGQKQNQKFFEKQSKQSTDKQMPHQQHPKIVQPNISDPQNSNPTPKPHKPSSPKQIVPNLATSPNNPPQPEIQIHLKKQYCRRYILQQQEKYGRLYRFDVDHETFTTNSNVSGFTEKTMAKITQEQFAEAIDLIDLIHHVDKMGNIVSEDNPCQKAQRTIDRLTQATTKQHQRLNQLYQIDFYHQSQLRFCIISNSFKNAENGLLYRNLDSILQQNYSNYHVVYTDDASPDNTGQTVKSYLTEKGVEEGKFKVKINAEKKGMMENIFNAITQDCELGEIAVMLDGDDSFIGTNVLSLLNAVYQKQKVALVWNNFIEVELNMIGVMGFSRNYIDFEINEPNFRKRGILLSSHLKSFYVDLFRKIKVQDLQQQSGAFYGGASDTAMMLPMLEMSFPHFKYIPQIVYEYRIDTGQLGMIVNRDKQMIALEKIKLSGVYQRLSDFSFVENSISKAQMQKI